MNSVANNFWTATAFAAMTMVSVVATAQPVVNFGNDTTVCAPSWTLNAGNAGATYLWSTGATSQTISVSAAGNYAVTVTDMSGTGVDDINLGFSPTVIISDTTVCSGNLTLTASGNANTYLWYTVASGGTPFHFSNSYSYTASSSSSFWVEGWNGTTCTGMGRTNITLGAYTTMVPSTARGIRFVTSQSIVLQEVTVYYRSAGAATATVELRPMNGGAGTAILSKSVSLAANSSGGPNVISLNFYIPAAGTYDLVLTGLSGGQIHTHSTCGCFPFNYSCMNLTGGVLNGNGGGANATTYNVFYDWKASTLDCNSGRQQTDVTVVATPVVNLPTSLTMCGSSYMLGASVTASPSANYLWSTGATTDSILVTTSGTYGLTVSEVGCAGSDAVAFNLYANPDFTGLLPAYDYCTGDTFSWSGSAPTYLMYDAAAGGNILSGGDTVQHAVTQTDTVWIEGWNGGSCTGIGRTTASPGSYVNMAPPATRGMRFTTLQPLILQEVTVYFKSATAATATVSIPSLGYSKNITLLANAAGGGQVVQLHVPIPVAGTYDLILGNLSSGQIHTHVSCGCFPFTSSCLNITGGLSSGATNTTYSVFYDWKVMTMTCGTSRQQVILNALPVPDLSFLPTDTLHCGSSLYVDASVGGSGITYQWSAGNTTSDITILASGVYDVTATQNGICSDIANIDVELYPLPNVSTLLGAVAGCVGDTLEWVSSGFYLVYDTAVAGSPIAYYTDTVSYPVTQTDTIWVEGWSGGIVSGIGRTTDALGAYATMAAGSNRGMRFTTTQPLVLQAVTIYFKSATAATATITIPGTGYSQTITLLANVAGGPQVVSLNTPILVPGTYDLLLSNLSGGQIHTQVSCGCFPFTYPSLSITAGLSNGATNTTYSIFYDWKIMRLDCETPRTQVNITALPTPNLSFVPADTLYCGATLTLDATVQGAANYQWSNGGTNATTNITQGGNYAVTVTQSGFCTDHAQIAVEMYPEPSFTALPATVALCVGDTFEWVNSTVDVFLMYDTAVGGNVQYYSIDTLAHVVQQSDTLWVEGWNGATVTALGQTTAAAGAYFTLSAARGIRFTALQNLILNSVTIFAEKNTNSPAVTGIVELRDAGTTNVIYSTNVSLTNNGANIVDLDYFMLGGDYDLVIQGVAGGKIYLQTACNCFPYDHSPILTMTRGVVNSNTYEVFYNWEVSTLRCNTARTPLVIDALPTPNLDFIDTDTLACGASLLLDATVPGTGVVYAWSNGATTPSILVASIDDYGVTVTQNGICSDQTTIHAEIYPYPDLSALPDNVSLCVGDTFDWSNPQVPFYYVYDAASGGNLIGRYVQSLDYIVSQDDTVWVEGRQARTINNVGLLNATGGSTSAVTSDRGLDFTAIQDFLLEKVVIFADLNVGSSAVVGTIQLRQSGVVIYSTPMNLTIHGANTVNLNYFVPAGNYELVVLGGISGGRVYANLSCGCFPLGYPSYVSITNGFGTGSSYEIFYDWTIRLPVCNSALEQVIIDALPTPDLSDLPSDTVVCGLSLFLDATDAIVGTSYNWSNGSTSPTLLLTPPTDTISITATFGTCSDSKGIDIDFAPPVDPIVLPFSDTSVCTGDLDFWVSGNAQNYLVYNSSTATTPLFSSSIGQITIDVVAPDTFWVSGWTGQTFTGLGEPVNAITSNGNYFTYTGTPLGLRFDVIEYPIIIQNVTVYAENPSSFAVVELRNAANQVIRSTDVQFYTSGANILPLNFYVPVGAGYRLTMKDIVGTRVYREVDYTGFPLLSPAVEPAIRITRGHANADNYEVFYNWEVSNLLCESPREAMAIDTLFTPYLNFPSDTVSCGDTVFLDATQVHPNVSFNWSTGATSPMIFVAESDTVTITATAGLCSATQTVGVIIALPPTTVNVPNDTTICGGVISLQAGGDAYTYAWYTSQTGGIPLAYGDSVTLTVQDTTTIWVEGVGFMPIMGFVGESSIGIVGADGDFFDVTNTAYPTRGLVFDVLNPIILNNLSIYTENAGVGATIKLVNQYGAVVYSKSLLMTNAGENVIMLNWFIAASYDYTMVLENITGGAVYILTTYNFPLIQNNVVFREGYPANFSDAYPFFLRWRISVPSCATERYPVNLFVPAYPDITLPADTAACAVVDIGLSACQNSLPSYTYLWSSGETTNDIIVNQTGYYSVTVTNDNLCSREKDVFAQILQQPNTPNINDTTICASSLVSLAQDAPDAISVWYELPSTVAQNVSAPYTVFVDSTTYFAVEAAARATTRLGQPYHLYPDNGNLYNNFIIPNTFNVHTFSVLDSVAVYVENAPTTFDMVLEQSGIAIASRTVTVNQANQKVFIPLGFVLPPGNNYQLLFGNISTRFLVDMTASYPSTSSANIATLTGSSIPGVSYACFYDWHFAYGLFSGCVSARDTFAVHVQIPLRLPDAIFTCDTALLDASAPSIASYLWSNGEISPSIAVTNPGTYTVTVFDGGACTAVDTTVVSMPAPIGFPVSGVNCGLLLDTDYSGTGSSFVWSTGATTESINISGPGTYAVTVTSSPTSAGGGCVISDTTVITQIEAAPPVYLGLDRARCFADTIDAGLGANYTYLWNTGATGQTLPVTTSGAYTVTVTSINGCTATDQITITIQQNPVADFIYFNSGNAVNFVSQATNTTAWAWNFGDSTVGFVASPFHNYANVGCYEVTLVALNSCGTDTITQTVAVGVPIEECNTAVVPVQSPSVWDFSIVPNPNNGHFHVWLSAVTNEPTELSVWDLHGRLIFRESYAIMPDQTAVELPSLPTGMYWLQLTNRFGHKTKRFVVSD